MVTQGVYTGVEDFKDKIVRHLMVWRFKDLPLKFWVVLIQVSRSNDGLHRSLKD